MKIFVMETCPGCKAVKEKISELEVENRFTYVDVHDGYEGYMPPNVPVMQDNAVGTIEGEQLLSFLDKVYGK